MEPQAWVDSIAPRFLETWELLDISNDDFIRTTEERHKRGVKACWQSLHDRGFLYRGTYDGWYCVPDETYWTDEQLADGACPTCGRPVERIREENWFFKLSEFAQPLLELYAQRPGLVQPDTRRTE